MTVKANLPHSDGALEHPTDDGLRVLFFFIHDGPHSSSGGKGSL